MTNWRPVLFQRFGRWLSADWSSAPVAVPYANLTNPQTLNLYSMVADDPESFADLDGHVSTGVLYPGSGYVAALGCESHPDKLRNHTGTSRPPPKLLTRKTPDKPSKRAKSAGHATA